MPRAELARSPGDLAVNAANRPMTEHFDTLETRDPDARERALLAALAAQIAHAKATRRASRASSPASMPRGGQRRARRWRGCRSRASPSCSSCRRRDRPFGGLAADAAGASSARVFASPGPIYEPEGTRPTTGARRARCSPPASAPATWCTTRFSYHFTPAGSMLETGAHALGCTVFPGGIGQTELQVQAIARPRARRLRRHAVVPARSSSRRPTSWAPTSPRSRRRWSRGEAFPPALRDALAARGIAGYQGYGTADLGSIAYEIRGARGPGRRRRRARRDRAPRHRRSGRRRARSAKSSSRRFNAGLSADPLRHRRSLGASCPARSPCGRTNMRIKGWMGRADQTTKVKGMFVHPSQVAEIVRRHPEIARARLVVDNAEGNDRMTLHVEVPDNRSTLRRSDRRVDPRRHQAARRGRVPRARAACPTTAR